MSEQQQSECAGLKSAATGCLIWSVATGDAAGLAQRRKFSLFFAPRLESCSGSHVLFAGSAVVVKQAEEFYFFVISFNFCSSVGTLQGARSVIIVRFNSAKTK